MKKNIKKRKKTPQRSGRPQDGHVEHVQNFRVSLKNGMGVYTFVLKSVYFAWSPLITLFQYEINFGAINLTYYCPYAARSSNTCAKRFGGVL